MSENHYLKTELYEKLRTDPSLFEWIEQGSLDGLWYWDLENQEHEWLSPRFKQIFGYEEDEIPHTSAWWQENIFQEDLPAVLENFTKHCEDPAHTYDQIVRYRHKTGKTIWVRCRGLVSRDANGRPNRMLGAHTDVTSLMETKETLEQTSEQLKLASEISQLALNSSGMGIWSWKIAIDQLHWDDNTHKLYQTTKESFGGRYRDWLKHIHPRDLDRVENAIQYSVTKQRHFDSVFRLLRDDGSVRYVRTTANVYCGENGEPERMLGAILDVTEERLRQIELERSNADLSTFAYAASHDLRAPLRGIQQLAGWVEDDLGEVPEEVAKNLHSMKERIGRMENLLDDLLAYSRVGRQTSTKIEKAVDTGALVKETFHFMNPPTQFELKILDPLPVIPLEKAPFEQVLRNLIGNAIQHRQDDKGTISVWCETEGGQIKFFVGDSGSPIPLKHHQRVFDMFQTLCPPGHGRGQRYGPCYCYENY